MPRRSTSWRPSPGVSEKRPRGRKTFIAAENEPQEAKLVRPLEQGGYGIDALWNDDFHHAAMVALTGHNEAYYTDYHGSPQEFISAVKWGYLYQGQRYQWQKKRRGTPALDLAPAQFVTFIQNHDQVANSASGLRCHALTSPGRYRAMTALLLLGPGTPMLFQGQEFAASSPFFFFADHAEEKLPRLVRQGRAKFLSQFPSAALPDAQAAIPDPGDPATLARCKLDLTQRQTHAPIYALHRDLLRLRREDPVLGSQEPRGVDGAVLGREAFVLRFFRGGADDRLLVVNLGRDLRFDPAPSRCWRRPPSGAGDCCGRARTSATAAAARRRRDGGWLAHPRRGGGGPLARDAGVTPHAHHGDRRLDRAHALGHRRRRKSRAAGDARMAGDQRPGRLRLGHARRRGLAPLPRPARRGPARAARPAGDAQPPVRAGPAAERTDVRLRRRGDGPASWTCGAIDHFQEFRLEGGLPVWRYEVAGVAFEKRVLLPHRQNTVHVNYRLVAGEGPVRLKLRPSVHFRRTRRRSARRTRSRTR